jgi:putative membrane protein
LIGDVVMTTTITTGFMTIGHELELGPLSSHMGAHIVLMNLLAPLLAVAVVAWSGRAMRTASRQALTSATLFQIILLWGAHAPIVLALAMRDAPLHMAVQGALFGSSLLFWWAVLAQRDEHLWRSLFALLVTGKLFCLLGALLVFAPRLLYPNLAAPHAGVVSLSDQQLAGLLMLIACPLSYVLAGVIISARWLRSLAAASSVQRTC